MEQIILVQEEPRGPSQLIEVPYLSTSGQRVKFPDIQQLRSTPDSNITVKGMRLITAGVLAAGPTVGGTTAPDTELRKMSLVIYCEGWEKAQYIPLFVLNDVVIPGGTTPARYNPTKFANWKNVDWTKSYLQFSNGQTPAGNYVVMFEVEYERLTRNGNVIEGPM